MATGGTDLGDVLIEELIAAGVSEVRVRSVLTCESALGTCATCYGRSLATGKLVDVGEAVGIIAAQSIGEPGTQLTMRTFHTGGIAGDDITHGLPRVAELFEARVPKGMAPIAEASGRVRFEESDGSKGSSRRIVVIPDDGGDEREYPITRRSRPLVNDGDPVEAGTQLISGAVNPHDVLRIMGPREVQLHLVREVQEVYRSQGVAIHDKHIEVIIRQMLKRITVIESGATEFLPGSLVERSAFEAENRRAMAEGTETASGRPVLMGITKASLATESWLSAASFQETTRVLTDAAISARVRLAGRAEGERDHRQADPGRHRHPAVPQRRRQPDGGGPRGRLQHGRVRRERLLRVRQRGSRPVRPAGRVRLRRLPLSEASA